MKLTAFKKILPKASALLLSLVLTLMLMIGAASADSAGTTPIYSKADLFTERDMIQEADLSEAEMISVTSGEDVRITSAGVYVLSGTASETTIYVEADSEDKVQLVLKGLNITNETFPCIYVLTADKVFITTSADSSLTVTGTFRKDGSTKTDGVVFSKQDLVLNGTAALSVSSTTPKRSRHITSPSCSSCTLLSEKKRLEYFRRTEGSAFIQRVMMSIWRRRTSFDTGSVTSFS